MVGKYQLRIENKKVRYDLEIKRKYTIIKGDSATGKTYLRDMIESSESKVTCKVNVLALPIKLVAYKTLLQSLSNNIIVIDEDVEYMTSKEFAELLINSDNYFIIFTRKKLSNIPISTDEVFCIKSKTKYNSINKPYTITTMENTYVDLDTDKIIPDVLITEDAMSGYQFFSQVLNLDCRHAGGNSNVSAEIIKAINDGYRHIFAIVDGAAFGAFVEEVFDIIAHFDGVVCILAPESFEYLLIKAGVARYNPKMLTETYNYCDKESFLKECSGFDLGSKNKLQSWEQFYIAYLQYITKHYDFSYTKGVLNPYYLRFKHAVLDLLPDKYLIRR